MNRWRQEPLDEPPARMALNHPIGVSFSPIASGRSLTGSPRASRVPGSEAKPPRTSERDVVPDVSKGALST